MGKLIHVMLAVILLQGCGHIPVDPGFPASWSPPDETCQLPLGQFSNQGESDDTNFQAPPLAAVLFSDGLVGYPVEGLSFAPAAVGGQVIVSGVLAGIPLKKQSTIPISCDEAWHGVTNTGAVNATLRSEAMLWTGGVILPLSQKYRYRLLLLQDGALLVRLRVRETALGALILPLSFSDDHWLRYERMPEATPSQPLTELEGPPK